MTSLQLEDDGSQNELDEERLYSTENILLFEMMFGRNYISNGGESTTKDLIRPLKLHSKQHVLDIGCGIGGNSFFMAREAGCTVLGFDNSSPAITIARSRLKSQEQSVQERVSLQVGNVEKIVLSEKFDVVFSKNVFFHIEDKENMFQNILKWLKNGGTLFFTVFVIMDQAHSQEYLDYVKDNGFSLITIAEYNQILVKVGFEDIDSLDITDMLIDTYETELKRSEKNKGSFLKDFSEESYKDMRDLWLKELMLVKRGEIRWGQFMAKKIKY